MRNLKRALSLVLAAAMLIGMMVVSAGAAGSNDFTDKDEIVNNEAVSVLVTLGVINGKEDGSYFDPTGIVTRAEMAKMITVVLNGGKDPVLGVKDKPSFTDIKGTWAESYIEYCTSPSVGVISGRGDGTFDPTATVTAAEAAKMLLVAMGYNANVFKLTGASWQINTDVYANSAKLYDGLSITSSAQLTRDNAAQMIYNAVQSPLMERSWSMNQQTGQITEGYNLADGTMGRARKSLLSEKFGVVKVEGVVTGNEFTDGAAMKGKTSIAIISNGDEVGSKVVGTTYNVATGADELGKSVTMYVKPAASSTSSVRASVLGSAIINSNNTVFTTGGLLVDNATKINDLTKALKAEGLKFEDANTVTAYTNYANDNATYTNGATAATNDADYAGGTGLGIATSFIDNNADGKIDVVTYVKKSFGRVSTVSTAGTGKLGVAVKGSANVALSTSTASTDVADFANLDLAKGDYVTYIKVAGIYYIEKVEGTTVAISSKQGIDGLCKVNGTYFKSALASATDMSSASGDQDFLDVAVTLGKEAVLYLDEYNNVMYVDSVAADTNFLMITGLDSYSTFNGSLQAKVVLQDGTTATVKIASLNNGTATIATDTLYVKSGVAAGTKAAASEVRGTDPYGSATNVFGGEYFTVGNALDTTSVYSYTTDSTGAYALKAETDDSASAAIIRGNSGSISGKVLNSGTLFVVKSGTTWTTYTGIGAVPSLASSTVYYAYDSTTNVVKAVFVAANAADTLNNTLVILGGTPVETDDNGTTVYTYDVFYKGELTTLTANATAVSTINGTKGLYTGATISNNQITAAGTLVSASEVTACAANVITTTAAAGTTTSQVSYTYDDSTKVYVVTNGVAAEGTIGDIVVKDTNVTPNIAGSNVVIIARGGNSATDGTKFIADTIVIFK